MRAAAAIRSEIIALVVDTFHIYNFLPPLPLAQDFLEIFCGAFAFICRDINTLIVHDDLDNLERVYAAIPNLPTGSSWRNFNYYG